MWEFKKISKNPMFWIAIVYMLFPMDFIPDAIPIAGNIDDVIMFIWSSLVQSQLAVSQNNNHNDDT